MTFRDIPAESLEAISIPAPNYHSRVQAETLGGSTLLPDSRLHILDLEAIPKAHDSLAGAQEDPQHRAAQVRDPLASG